MSGTTNTFLYSLNHAFRVPEYAPESAEEITKQAPAAECDIYNILKQYQRTGILTHIARAAPRFEDLPDASDYQQAMNAVIAADDAFQALPASVRDSFHNDPEQFLRAFADPAQEAKLRELGLLKPRPAADPAAPAPAAPKEA